MTPQVQARIFEPFFTTKPVGRGTGLGLATVFGIVTKYEGFLDVQSAPGAGSVFSVYLPAAQEAPREAWAPVASSIRAEGNERILLVEDEAARALHGPAVSGEPFLQKPFTASTLLAKVRAVLDGKG